MAITNVNRYYDVNLDMHFDSYEHYIRHKDQMRYEQRRMYEQEQMMRAQQQQMGYIPYGSPLAAVGQTGTLLHKEDKNDPLAFLKKADNKLLLTGEM